MMDVLSYRNQSIDLLNKSMDWFLYDKDSRHERINEASVSISIIIHTQMFEILTSVSQDYFNISSDSTNVTKTRK